MAVVQWPAGVPSGAVDGYSQQSVSSVSEFQPEVGPPISRKRTTANMDVGSLTIERMTRAEFDVFRTWYETDLACRVHHFEFVDPLTTNGAIYKMTDEPTSTLIPPNFIRVSFPVLRVRWV